LWSIRDALRGGETRITYDQRGEQLDHKLIHPYRGLIKERFTWIPPRSGSDVVGSRTTAEYHVLVPPGAPSGSYLAYAAKTTEATYQGAFGTAHPAVDAIDAFAVATTTTTTTPTA